MPEEWVVNNMKNRAIKYYDGKKLSQGSTQNFLNETITNNGQNIDFQRISNKYAKKNVHFYSDSRRQNLVKEDSLFFLGSALLIVVLAIIIND